MLLGNLDIEPKGDIYSKHSQHINWLPYKALVSPVKSLIDSVKVITMFIKENSGMEGLKEASKDRANKTF